MPIPFWIISALAAHALSATTQLADRFFLTKRVPDPISYAFFIGIYTSLGLLLAPFFLFWPGVAFAARALAGGIIFVAALIPFFTALRKDDASSVIPATGSAVALGTLVVASALAVERLAPTAFIAFGLLVAGQIVLAARTPRASSGQIPSFLPQVILAGILFGAAAVLRRIVYTSYPLTLASFINASLWIGIGMTLGALLLLAVPAFRARIFVSRPAIRRPQNIALFAAKQFTSGASGILLNLAIAIAPAVSLVQATQGAQYLFLLVFVVILSLKFPGILKEEISKKTLVQKIAAVALIMAGLAVLALQ